MQASIHDGSQIPHGIPWIGDSGRKAPRPYVGKHFPYSFNLRRVAFRSPFSESEIPTLPEITPPPKFYPTSIEKERTLSA
jgi:hypothetical protein